jgi:hypothetical protein
LHPASHKDIPTRRIYYLGSSLTHEAWFSTQLTCPFIWMSCGIAERAACLSPFHPARILCDLKNMTTTTHNMRSCSICHQYSTPYPANHLSVRMARSACVPAVRTRRADAPEPQPDVRWHRTRSRDMQLIVTLKPIAARRCSQPTGTAHQCLQDGSRSCCRLAHFVVFVGGPLGDNWHLQQQWRLSIRAVRHLS